MVSAARKAIESQYQDTCDIVEYKSYTKANKSTAKEEVTVLQNQPCKLSYSTLKSNTETISAEMVSQIVKLFIAPEIIVKPGSKLIVLHQSRTLEFKNSGKPGVFSSHQEIILELFDGWA
ncbi:hypothetical protein SDC9_187086 [bioreactor metagenome]|uniref:Phage protein n=1 Tax=bioreactor metagenome TaxID=1076179 RepID=A0A645HKN1_9ZZZZ|nr:hypothetical protein [Oscillospiraceae bacterium]